MTGTGYAILAYGIALSMMLLYGLGMWRQRRKLLRRVQQANGAAAADAAAPPAREPDRASPAATLTAAE